MYQHSERRQRRDYEIKKSNKIYVSNLNNSVSQDDLRTLFEAHGTIQNVTLKHKDTITFAFIEFSSASQAQAAINAMNGKNFSGQQIKVQYSKGGNDRRSFGDRGGRGGYNNDREGGYNRSSNYEDRPKRDFGDRPRGCFNCGKQGHMIKDCTEPKKPRENREGGGFERRGGYNSRPSEGGERSYGGNRGGYGNRSYGDRQGSGRGGYNSYKRNDRKRSDSRSRSRSHEKRQRNRSQSGSR